MRKSLTATAAIGCSMPGVAVAQDGSTQPPTTGGETALTISPCPLAHDRQFGYRSRSRPA